MTRLKACDTIETDLPDLNLEQLKPLMDHIADLIVADWLREQEKEERKQRNEVL